MNRSTVMDRVSSARLLLALSVSALTVACGGSDDGAATDSAFAAESLVVGDWLGETGLLVLPLDGGRAELRTVVDPSRTVWRGRSRLPGSESALVADERSIVLRTPAGAAYRFDPIDDEATLERGLEKIDGWSTAGDQIAIWSDKTIHVVREGESRAYTAPGPVAWAMAVPEAGVVALMEAGGAVVLISLDEGSAVQHQVGLEVRPPGVATAWGGSALFLSPDGRQLMSVRLPELDVERRFDFRRAVTAVSVSASSHEVYVALSGRIEAIERMTGEGRRLADIDEEITELRPGIYGQQLLAFGGGAVFRVSLTGDPPVRLDVDWRTDLPLGLPNGDILATRGDSLHVVRLRGRTGDGIELTPVEGPSAAVWLPVRWNPVAERLEAPVAGASEEPEEAGEEPETLPDSTEGREGLVVPGDSVAAPDDSIGAPGDSVGAAFAAPAAGYYAVAMASPEPSGVIELVGALSRSGYPTAIQRRRDDGGQMWYRALLGPYAARERAEAAARQLRRERGLDAWVTEVAAGTEGEF